MSSDNPYRHEIKRKLKTQVVRDKTKYNRKREKLPIKMMREAEEKNFYEK